MTGPLLTMVAPMRDVPVGLRPRLRELSEGPDLEWGFWGWTHHDGSTYAALGFDGATVAPERCVGWAGLTFQVDVIPVIGVYVQPESRRGGRGELLVRALLHTLRAHGILHPGAEVAAATGRWGRYHEILASCGLRCRTWGS